MCAVSPVKHTNTASSIQNLARFGGGGCTGTVTAARVLRPRRAAETQRLAKTQEHPLQAPQQEMNNSSDQQSQLRGKDPVFSKGAWRSGHPVGRSTWTPASC